MWDVARRTHVEHPQYVHWPHAPVKKHFEYHLQGKTLSVVHVGLGRVISEDAIHHDHLLTDGCASV